MQEPPQFVAILQAIPPPLHVVPAGGALVAFEREHFPPGTAANDLYQIAVFAWEQELYSATIFPRSHFARCAAAVRAVGLALAPGAPSQGGETLDVNEFLPPWLRVPAGGTFVYRQLSDRAETGG